MTSYESAAPNVSSIQHRTQDRTRDRTQAGANVSARSTTQSGEGVLQSTAALHSQAPTNASSNIGLTLAASDTLYDGVPHQEFLIESAVMRVTRRLIDIIVSAAALVVFGPLMIVIALMIRLDSPGPALFFQRRLGRDRRQGPRRRMSLDPKTDRRQQTIGRQIWFVKFRTMHVDSKQRFPDLYQYTYDDQQLETVRFKVESDPRVTRVGVWLRKSSLDELPNFWNVLTGQMTLVGPRPEIPQMLKYYSPAQQLKFAVKPGITGPAQVYGRGLLSFQNTVRLDLSYVRNRNLRYDARILMKTIQSVLQKDGAF